MKLPVQPATPPQNALLRTPRPKDAPSQKVVLPEPDCASGSPLTECLRLRRSGRDYSDEPLRIEEISQLLWAAQGITAPGGLRTAPSPGAIYPLRSYFVAFRVQGLTPGFYSYDADTHSLTLLAKGDKQKRITKAAADQQCVAGCAAALLLTAWYKRIQREFGDSAATLTAMEAGHIGQNWLLQATALGLGAIGVGKLDTTAIKMLLPVPQDEEPLYLLLAGRV